MKKIVLTIREDVCNANGKTEENINLLVEKMRLYGTVTDFDAEVAAVKAEYQDNLNKVTAQYNKIRSNELNAPEIAILNAIRKFEAEITAEKDAEIAKYIDLVGSIQNRMKDMIKNVVSAVAVEEAK